MISERCSATVTMQTKGFTSREDAMSDSAIVSARLGARMEGTTEPTGEETFGWTATFFCQGFCEGGKKIGSCLKEKLETNKQDLGLGESAVITGDCVNSKK